MIRLSTSSRTSKLDSDESASSVATFSTVSVLDMEKIVSSASCVSCAQDLIPTWILKHVCKDELLPTIMDIINHSLSSGKFTKFIQVSKK